MERAVCTLYSQNYTELIIAERKQLLCISIKHKKNLMVDDWEFFSLRTAFYIKLRMDHGYAKEEFSVA